MRLVIAEKPSVARDLAKVLGATRKGEGFIEGNGFVFTWARGHLVKLAEPKHYGYTEWSFTNLPMLPKRFDLVVREGDGFAKKQLKVIDQLLRNADEVICATDAGREGELIFRNIYYFLKCSKPFKRLWISSQTEKAIRDGFGALKAGSEYDGLYQAARLRSESDWLVGLNGTQALSLAVLNRGSFSLGRVQTPTLVLICDRYLENTNFRPEIFFQLVLRLKKGDQLFAATSEKKWSNRGEADKVLSGVQNAALVKDIEVKKKTEPVPLLFDLTTLQQVANKKFGYSPDSTLKIAQALYERALITYPRTGSRYIGDDVFDHVRELIGMLRTHARFGGVARALLQTELSKRSVNAAKVTDHHALLITDTKPSALSKEEQNIYELVAGRMLEAFGQACIKEVTDVRLEASIGFLAKGVVVLVEGWRAVFGEADEEAEASGALPKLAKGESVAIVDRQVVQKQTAPRPLLTEATLLKAMETCGRDIDDEEAREALKDAGLGTPATRAEIIVKLFEREYIAKKNKALIPTEKGLYVYRLVKDKAIGKPVMTGDWEKMLSRVERKKMEASEFEQGIVKYTKNLVEEFKSLRKMSMENEEIVKCPKCKKGTLSFMNRGNLNGLVCSEQRSDCGFVVFRRIASRLLSDKEMLELVKTGKTQILKGFVRKSDGGVFDARLVLDQGYNVVFEKKEKINSH